MDQGTLAGLLGTAAFIGFLHTLTGPDHYVPFIAMGRVRGWSLRKTLLVALGCGVGHVGSSVVLGLVGIAASLAVTHLTWVEGVRGDLAAWLLLGFGLAYMVWGIRRAIRNQPHTHIHAHADGALHRHVHTHHAEHAHPHGVLAEEAGPAEHATAVQDAPAKPAADAGESPAPSLTPWVLFTIFVLGPCEPLIPILMFPALKLDLAYVPVVAGVFAVCTIGTMLALVAGGHYGLLKLGSPRLERYAHALAGASLAMCGLLMVLGL